MNSFSMMSSIVPMIVVVGFVLVFGMFIIIAVRGIGEWSKNNQSPVLNVEAKVVSKRQDFSYSDTAGDNNIHHSSSTSYYVTFEVESGDRMEFHVRGSDYGMIVEGDHGKLTFQGTRFLGFLRQ